MLNIGSSWFIPTRHGVSKRVHTRGWGEEIITLVQSLVTAAAGESPKISSSSRAAPGNSGKITVACNAAHVTHDEQWPQLFGNLLSQINRD